MIERADLSSLNPAGLGLSTGGGAGARTGTLGGMQFQVQDTATSALNDAKEEITFGHSEKVEAKEHGERDVKGGTRLRPMSIAQINEYLDKARNPEHAQELASLARRMLRGEADPQRLQRQGERFQRPTDQYLALNVAREMAASTAGVAAHITDAIADALDELHAVHDRQIQADLASIEQAGSFGRSAEEVRAFQGSIHEVLDQPSIKQALAQVMTLAGQTGGRFDAAMTHMTDALGACLAAARNTGEKVLLELLMRELYELKSLRTALEECKSLMRKLRKQGHPVHDRQRAHGRADPQDAGNGTAGA